MEAQDSADGSATEHIAATQMAAAQTGDPRWRRLATAMADHDSLPINGLTTAQLVKSGDELKLITSGCAALGVQLKNGGMPSDPTGLAITGTETGNIYSVNLWAHDTITNCALHAYGPALIAFLQSHPCKIAHRLLATVTVGGRDAVLSVITVGFPPTTPATHAYDENTQLQALELASGTGGINDLLREGKRIPGVAGSIPSTEAFTVTGQDAITWILDAWWASGPTTDQDPALIAAENDLNLSEIASFD